MKQPSRRRLAGILGMTPELRRFQPGTSQIEAR